MKQLEQPLFSSSWWCLEVPAADDTITPMMVYDTMSRSDEVAVFPAMVRVFYMGSLRTGIFPKISKVEWMTGRLG